jgi:PPK2 family polyphosphate:nucleotide phosphotransferase
MAKLKYISTLPDLKYSKKECQKDLKSLQAKLFILQNIFYADNRFGLLIILQGVDTSGKDGTIRHVMTCMNPMGVIVKSFKKPTTEELDHDFLWRVYLHFPAKGNIEIFNRSYYEAILIPSFSEKYSKDIIQHRFQMLDDLEEHLEFNNIHVLKFFLHISKSEQSIRIKERLTKPHKRWKYTKQDTKAGERWDDYLNVYDTIINKCNKKSWNIIPADKRWYRNYAVAKILTDHLESLHLSFPKT